MTLHECWICVGAFHGNWDAQTCSDACRNVIRKAKKKVYVEPACSKKRKEKYSWDRQEATGWGHWPVFESHQADLRVRYANDIADIPPFFGPGYWPGFTPWRARWETTKASVSEPAGVRVPVKHGRKLLEEAA